VALKSWNLNSEELLSCLGVPDPNIIETASGEELRISTWESNVVDSLIVAGVSQLWSNIVGVAPIDSGLGSTTEEVG